MPRRFWTCTIITTISALVSAGFSVVGLLAPSSSDSFARYAASRSIALLIAVLFCLGVRSREGIAALALVMSLVQGFDGIIGVLAHDPAKTYGPFVFALANFVGLVWLLRPQKGLERRVASSSRTVWTQLRRSRRDR
jgi:hypothetical protein